MRNGSNRRLHLLALLLPIAMSAKLTQITVQDTGSTNRPGLRVIFDQQGSATVEPAQGQSQDVKLPEALCSRFLHDLETAGPLNELPAAHCMKSVSFGSRTFVEYNGSRSPDLSCPSSDARSQSLEKDANDILKAARQAANLPSSRRVFTVPAPRPQ